MGQYEVYWMGVGACVTMMGVASVFIGLWFRARLEQQRFARLGTVPARQYAGQQI